MISVTFVIPTLNSEATLGECLRSIFSQRYPPNLIDVIVVDGGSVDSTLETASSFPTRIFHNKLRTGEAGKRIGLQAAENELVAFVDSDNLLPSDDWISTMVAAFDSKDVVGAEPVKFSYRSEDSVVNRFSALYGTADPLSYIIGNSNRWTLSRMRWASLSASAQIAKEGYFLVHLQKARQLPSLGANGFIGRRELLRRVCQGTYYFDIDVVHELSKRGFDSFAIVNTGIVHLFADDFNSFVRKTFRRIRDYFTFRQYRTYPWAFFKIEIAKFVLLTLLFAPLFRDAIRGYKRKPDVAWFFLPFGALAQLMIYGLVFLRFRALPH